MPEIVAPPATAITEAPPATRPKPAANTAHKRQIPKPIPRNERPITRQARPEPAEGDAREDRQGGQRRCCCRHCCQTQWPCAQAQTAQLKVVIGDQIVVASSQPRSWQSFIKCSIPSSYKHAKTSFFTANAGFEMSAPIGIGVKISAGGRLNRDSPVT